MAEQIARTIVSDISGENADVTVTLAVDGTRVVIDLTDAEHTDLLDAVGPYLDRGRPAGSTRRATSRTTGRATRKPRVDLAAVRAWAAEQGLQVATRGRVSAEISQAYQDAHPAA
jgi:hypothetical protein